MTGSATTSAPGHTAGGQASTFGGDARITPQAVAEIGKVVRKAETHPEAAPELLVAAQTLLERAETVSPRTLRKEVREQIESHAQGEPVVTLAIATTETTRERFRRARIVASNEAGAILTDGKSTVANVAQGCGDHHVALDAGLIQFVRWDTSGAVFRMPDGGARRERGPRDPPPWRPPADEVRERPPPWGDSRRSDDASLRRRCG